MADERSLICIAPARVPDVRSDGNSEATVSTPACSQAVTFVGFVLTLCLSSTYSPLFAQGTQSTPSTVATPAAQIPLSGRSGTPGAVSTTQSVTALGGSSVNIISGSVNVSGQYSGSSRQFCCPDELFTHAGRRHQAWVAKQFGQYYRGKWCFAGESSATGRAKQRATQCLVKSRRISAENQSRRGGIA